MNLFVSLVLTFYSVGLAADTLSWSQSQTEIVIPNSLYLGNSLSVGSNNIAVFGSNGADSSNGAAYVFTFDQPTNAWSQIQDLKPTGYSSTPFTFGSSSDVFQNTIVIGAASSNQSTGCAFTFSTTDGLSWSQQQILVASDFASGSSYGVSTAAIENTIFIGAPFSGGTAFGSGQVYVYAFENAQWTQTAILKGNDTVAGAKFGASLSATDGTLVVGSPGDGGGLVYTFSVINNKWSLTQTLKPIHSAGAFGAAVDIQPGTILAGDTENGIAYVFNFNGKQNIGWEQVALLDTVNGSTSDFGISVSLSINSFMQLAIVGAANVNEAFIYFFDNGAWTLQSTLQGQPNSQFGHAVVIQNGTALVAAPTDTGGIVPFIATPATFSPTVAPTSAPPTQAPTLPPTTMGQWVASQTSTQASGSAYGDCVAVDSSTALVQAVIGSPLAGTGGQALYWSLTSSEWQLQQTLVGLIPNGQFGTAASVSGGELMIGASGEDSEAGAAYYFILTNEMWTSLQRLVAADASSLSLFGSSVAMAENVLFVGAPLAGTDTEGQLYVFIEIGASWTQTQVLQSTQSKTANANFGWSLSVYGDSTDGVLAVGAPGQILEESVGVGAVFIFSYALSTASYSPLAMIQCPDDTQAGKFGVSVSLGQLNDDETVFVVAGSPNSNHNGVEGGAAFVFESDVGAVTTWSLTTTLVASDASNGANFGQAVTWSYNEDTSILVGAPFAANGAGRAYVFTPVSQSWSQSAELTYSSSQPANGGFGNAVGMSFGQALVGDSNNAEVFFFADLAMPTLSPTSNPEPGLSPGATAAVVIGVLGGVGIGVTAAYFLFFKAAAAPSSLMTPVLSPMSSDAYASNL